MQPPRPPGVAMAVGQERAVSVGLDVGHRPSPPPPTNSSETLPLFRPPENRRAARECRLQPPSWPGQGIISLFMALQGIYVQKGLFLEVRRVPRFLVTLAFLPCWRELSTDRFECYFNALTDVLTIFDDFLTINDDF
jgi:hypothetical protein